MEAAVLELLLELLITSSLDVEVAHLIYVLEAPLYQTGLL